MGQQRRLQLEGIQQQVINALTGVKGEATPGMGEFLRSVQKLVDDIKIPILQSHNASQEVLRDHLAAFDTCTDSFNDANEHIDTLRDIAHEASATHVACRLSQAAHLGEISACEADKHLKCNQAELACSLVNKTWPSCQVQTSEESDLVYLEGLKSFLIGERTAERERKTLCSNLTNNCEGHVCNVDNYSTVCNSNQAALETASCDVSTARDVQCTTYQRCFGAMGANFDQAVRTAQEEATNRQTEFRLIATIDCLIQATVSTESAELDHEAITACKKNQVNTSLFHLVVPTKPTEGDCVGMRASHVTSRMDMKARAQNAADAIAHATEEAAQVATSQVEGTQAAALKQHSQRSADAMAVATEDARQVAAAGRVTSSVMQAVAHSSNTTWQPYRPCSAEYVAQEYVTPFEGVHFTTFQHHLGEAVSQAVQLTCNKECPKPVPSARIMADNAVEAIAEATVAAHNAASTGGLIQLS
jgi:hypothetical protein